MKRFIVLILTIAFLVTFFASCKETNTEASSIPSASSEELVSSQSVVSSGSAQAEEKFNYTAVPVIRTFEDYFRTIDIFEGFPKFDTWFQPNFEAIKEGADSIIRCRVNGEHSVSTQDRDVGMEDIYFFFHTPVEVLEVYKGDVSPGESLEITGGSGHIPESIYWGMNEQYKRIMSGYWFGIDSDEQKFKRVKEIHYDHVPLSRFVHEKSWLRIDVGGSVILDDEEYIVFLKNLKDTDGTVYHFPYGQGSVLLIKGEKCYFQTPIDPDDLASFSRASWWYSKNGIMELIGDASATE